MESVRSLKVPFLLGSSTTPNGGFSNPGVWLMLWTQLTARLVQYWSPYSISFHLERPLSPWESTLWLSLLEGTRPMSPWVDIVWCPPLCVGLSAWGRFILLVSLLGTFLWSWRGCWSLILNLLSQLPWGFWHWRLHFCWHWPHLSMLEICRLCLSASPAPSLIWVWSRLF